MDGLSTASAVLGIIQVGFSLAKAIRETVKDYKDAADDLISLAQDIESTLHLVSELDKLVLVNDKTGMFSAGGLAELNKCQKNTEQIVKVLVELLTKTGVAHPPGTRINPEDLVISRSNRWNWLGRKSRVKDKQEELNKVRLEVITIIQFAKVLQASSSGEKAVQQALLLMSERERRKNIRTRRKKQRKSGQTQKPSHRVTAGALPGLASMRPASRSIDDGNRAIKSIAYHAATSEPVPVALNGMNDSGEKHDKAEDDLATEDTAERNTLNDKMTNGNAATGHKAHVNMTNSKTPTDRKAKGGIAHEEKANDDTAHEDKAGVKPPDVYPVDNDPFLHPPVTAVDKTIPSPGSRLSPKSDRPGDQDEQQLSREAIIEQFKHQTKADVSRLADNFQVKMERAATYLGRDRADHGLRKFLESELVQEWSDMHGNWLTPAMLFPPEAPTVEMKRRKPRRWPFPRSKQKNKRYDPTFSVAQDFDPAHLATLLVIESQKGQPSITPVDPVNRSKPTDTRKTSLTWSNLREETRTSIWLKLRSDFALPHEYHWILFNAETTDPGPSLLARCLMRLASGPNHTTGRDAVSIVAFVASYRMDAIIPVGLNCARPNGYFTPPFMALEPSTPEVPKKEKVDIANTTPYQHQKWQAMGDPFQGLDMADMDQFSNPDIVTHGKGAADPSSNTQHPSGGFSFRPGTVAASTFHPETPFVRMPQQPLPTSSRLRIRPQTPPVTWAYEPADSDEGYYPARPVSEFCVGEPSDRPHIDDQKRHRPERHEVVEVTPRSSHPLPPPVWMNYDRSALNKEDLRPPLNCDDQRESFDERNQLDSLSSDDSYLQELSDHSPDDAELFDQLLHKFTGHGLEEPLAVNEHTSEGDEDHDGDMGADGDYDVNEEIDEAL